MKGMFDSMPSENYKNRFKLMTVIDSFQIRVNASFSYAKYSQQIW